MFLFVVLREPQRTPSIVGIQIPQEDTPIFSQFDLTYRRFGDETCDACHRTCLPVLQDGLDDVVCVASEIGCPEEGVSMLIDKTRA